ncbi:MAG: ABC transporter ATP-binding protein [Deltaproteobacteria bacterium]|nr:ABC transporter ATP-binding protein [Deltaproteobacteria bacterium]
MDRPPVFAISLQSITKAFGSTVALDAVSFDVTAGHAFGLIGPNGAGKTTAFSIIAGYLHPDSGLSLVLDHDSRAIDVLKARLAVLPQDALLPTYETVGEFLVHMAHLQGIETGAEAAARQSLAEVEGADWWSRRCGKLSHGMAKRVALAQAFLGKPEVVLLDEPTAGLDPKIAFEVRALIKKRKGRCTLVISSHNLHELEEICDAAAILDHGKIVAAGTMEDLTAATREIRITVARGPLPMDKVRALPGVTRADYVGQERALTVHFDATGGDAEDMIGQVLTLLLSEKIRISGVMKGKGLEQRVMELTD